MRMKNHAPALLALSGLVTLALDLGSKAWALRALGEGQHLPLVGQYLYLELSHNPGAAFSLLSGHAWVFAVVAVVVLALSLWAAPRLISRRWALGMGLLCGGALGNLYDRLARPPYWGNGHVVDFIGYYTFFIGNVADIALVGGAAYLAYLYLREIPALRPSTQTEVPV